MYHNGNKRRSTAFPESDEGKDHDRGKNAQTLIDLEITPKYRDSVIINIEVEDYSEGPVIDTLNQCGEMWVFGKDVKGQEVYHPMNYPFK